MINVYAVKDCKSFFWTPFTSPNNATAQREFSMIIRHPDASMFVKDLELWCLGEYDEHTGAITSNPEYVCASVDVYSPPVNMSENNSEVVDE